jgi:hypothetical protein
MSSECIAKEKIMKTSELKKYLSSRWVFEETEYSIRVKGFVTVNKHNGIMTIETCCITSKGNGTELLKKMIEYTETPIEEREEEKKYYLRSIINYSKNFDKHYIKFDCSKKEYYFFETNHDSGYAIESKFTDKQISEMPIEIQKAIECGFLKKVLVE